MSHRLSFSAQDVTDSGLSGPARWGRCSCGAWWKSLAAPDVADRWITARHETHVADLLLRAANGGAP